MCVALLLLPEVVLFSTHLTHIHVVRAHTHRAHTDHHPGKYRAHHNIPGNVFNDWFVGCFLCHGRIGRCQPLGDYEIKNQGRFELLGKWVPKSTSEKTPLAGAPASIMMES